MPTSTDLDFLVDQCLNNPEYEWAGCSVRIVGMGKKTKEDALKDIKEVAVAIDIPADDAMLLQAFDTIKENILY